MSFSDVESWFEDAWGSTNEALSFDWQALVSHGNYCGPGSQGGEPVDDLDRCCQRHDADYGSVGISHESMWTTEGLLRTREADARLAECAPSAETDASDAYVYGMVQLFSRRVEMADALREAQRALEQVEDAIDDVKRQFLEWLDAAGDLFAAADDPATRESFDQYMQYLVAEGWDAPRIDAALRDHGQDPDALRAAGYAFPA